MFSSGWGHLCIAAGLAACLAPGAARAQQPASAPVDANVDRILTRLEERKINDLRARVRWELTYAIEEEDESDVKTGELCYKEMEPVAKFIVHFKEKLVGGRKMELDEKHMFDGRWYTELQSRTRTISRREVRRPGDAANPYKLGEGVFPLPFGQRKEDILREFEVSLAPPAKGDPEHTDHLRLLPREGTQTGQTYKQIDFWVAQEGPLAGLPVQVVASKKSGSGEVNSYITIAFSDVQLNPGLSSSVFHIDTPPGYEEIVETLDPVSPPASAPSSPQ